jgi:hypothetical protein
MGMCAEPVIAVRPLMQEESPTALDLLIMG